MKIGNSEFNLTTKSGKFFVSHIFDGKVVDAMKVYDICGNPYIKRLGEKMYLPNELINEMRLISAH